MLHYNIIAQNLNSRVKFMNKAFLLLNDNINKDYV